MINHYVLYWKEIQFCLPTSKPAGINFCSRKSVVKCSPQPDALNPCEDIMGFYWLRISVWLVGSVALMANVVVLTVVFRKSFNNSVPRFLMSNLAFADFCTAVYLLLLAYEDLVSSEKYFNYAYTWQNGNYKILNSSMPNIYVDNAKYNVIRLWQFEFIGLGVRTGEADAAQHALLPLNFFWAAVAFE